MVVQVHYVIIWCEFWQLRIRNYFLNSKLHVMMKRKHPLHWLRDMDSPFGLEGTTGSVR